MSNPFEPSPVAAPILPLLALGGRKLLPIVQGGMGVGVSAHRLAGSVARQGAVGTLASVDLRHHHADLMQDTAHSGDKSRSNWAKRSARDRECRAVRERANGNGRRAGNGMRSGEED